MNPLVRALTLVSAACVPHHPRALPILESQYQVIGHRGAAKLAPENTHAGFRICTDAGLPFELDVTLSSDGRLVVIHDDTLDRTTPGSGPVHQTDWPTMSGLDAGSWLDPKWSGETLPLLPDVLRQHKVPIDIELKSPPDTRLREPLARAVVAAVVEAGANERVLLTSFDPFLLEFARQAGPQIARGQLLGTFTGTDLKAYEKWALQGLFFNARVQPDVLAVEAAFIRPGWLRRMKARGYRILAWTVNDPAEGRRLLALGVDGLITDDPLHMRAALAEGNPPFPPQHNRNPANTHEAAP